MTWADLPRGCPTRLRGACRVLQVTLGLGAVGRQGQPDRQTSSGRMCACWREWPPQRKGASGAGAGPVALVLLPCSQGQAACPAVSALALSPADPHSARQPLPAPLRAETLQPGDQGLRARLAMAPGSAALQPRSLELFQGLERLPESSILVLVGLKWIQICFSDGALTSAFSRNLPSSAPLSCPLPALSSHASLPPAKVVTGLGADRMKHTGGTPSHRLKSEVWK